MEPVHLTPLDRRLLHALHATPRASFRELAAGLGVSDQTVARRYRAMEATVGLRVLGRLAVERVGGTSWFVRLQCTPDVAMPVARALARRTDTTWVRLASGGSEVYCTVESRERSGHNALLLDGLSGSRRVMGISVHALLHRFSPVEWRTLTGAAQTADDPPASSNGSVPGNGDQVAIDDGDELLLQALAVDGRASAAALAAAGGWNEATVRRRISRLYQSGALYFDVDIDDVALGFWGHTQVWLAIEPAHLDEVGRAVAAMHEVPYVAATTGPTNLLAVVVTDSSDEVYRFLTEKIGALSGVRGVESTPVLRTVKRSGTVLAD